jgi:hypothetical protein
LIFTLLFISCQSTREIDQQLIQPQDPPFGFSFNDEGALVHEQSGAVFPLYLDKFQRGEVHIFNDEGSNISVGYSLIMPAAEATIYIYPTNYSEDIEITLDEEFDNAESSIKIIHPSAILVLSFPITMDENMSTRGAFAFYYYKDVFRDKHHNLGSELVLYKKVDWFIKFRITYPLNRRTVDKALKMKDAFDFSKIP